jgi:hypothetical protein
MKEVLIKDPPGVCLSDVSLGPWGEYPLYWVTHGFVTGGPFEVVGLYIGCHSVS